MAVSDAGGNVHIYEVVNNKDGILEFISRKDMPCILIHRSQWLPGDNGMFAVTQPDTVSLVDTNTFKIVDTYRFNPSVVFWSDWNSNDVNLIAVALGNSCIRFIDIRAGNSVQTITTKSPIQSKAHNMTRILWTPLDAECLFAGDSSGYIHLYDIRRSKQAVQLVGEDYTSCETICSMEYNPKKTNLIISQGRDPKTTMWSFKEKKLRNTNVNFSMNTEARGAPPNRSRHMDAFIKYQVYVTDRFLFKPIINNFKEISIHDLHTGRFLNEFSSPNWQPNSLCDASSVLGLYDNYNVLYSGSKNSIKLWNRKVVTDQEKERINRMHQDNWSDDD